MLGRGRRDSRVHIALYIADYGLAALGGEGWLGWRFAVSETPGKERVVYELKESQL